MVLAMDYDEIDDERLVGEQTMVVRVIYNRTSGPAKKRAFFKVIYVSK